MLSHTQRMGCFAVEFVLSKFREGLKMHHLLQHAAEYNAFVHQMMTFELVYAAEFPSPDKKASESEEAPPSSIELDHNATFTLKQISIPHQEEHPQLEHQISNQQKRQKKIKKENSLAVNEADKGVFALSEPIATPAQCQLEEEIGEIKKRLNFMRRIRRENEDEERKRCEQFLNRKHLELPPKQFAFDFSGEFLFKKKPIFKKGLTVIPNAKSEDISEFIHKQKNKQDEEDSERDMLVSRGQGGSRDANRILFGNSGKRQVSNLPFIKLGQNIKLTQNHRSAAGPDTSRYTLKSYHSRGESTFKSFAEMEKERTQRLYSLKRSSKFSEATDEDVQQKPATTHVELRRQSKRMQKYLKKLSEDRSKDFVLEINKSSNFNRLNSPHDYSIHRYYKHNFDDDKKSICDSSLVSLRLNNSHLQQPTATCSNRNMGENIGSFF